MAVTICGLIVLDHVPEQLGARSKPALLAAKLKIRLERHEEEKSKDEQLQPVCESRQWPIPWCPENGLPIRQRMLLNSGKECVRHNGFRWNAVVLPVVIFSADRETL